MRTGPLRLALMAASESRVTPDGKIVDAEAHASSPSARERLREAALAVERAREPSGGDDRSSLWKVLVAGEWSLVEQFESDGKRFLIARESTPQLKEPGALTPREGQVLAHAALRQTLELMANELGLPVATVAEARDSSARKLGVELLSAREREVVEQAALGSHNKAIAYDLGLAHSTVKVLMSRAAAKLGVRTRSELLAKVGGAVESCKPT